METKTDLIKVGDLVTGTYSSNRGRVGVVLNVRSNNSASIVWLADCEFAVINIVWLKHFKIKVNKKRR